MALSIIKEPSLLSLSRQSAWFRFLTVNFLESAGTAAVYELTIPNGITVGSSFDLLFNSKRYTFLCVASGGTNGYTFKTYASLGAFNLTVADFQGSYHLNKYYTLVGDYPGSKIVITAKSIGTKWNMDIQDATGGIALNQIVAGVDDVFRPNFKAFVDIHIQADPSTNPVENLIAQTDADPHQDDITTVLAPDEYVLDFELQEIIHSRLVPYIPAYNMSTPAIALGSFLSYWVRYGEIYDTEPKVYSNAVYGSIGNYRQVIIGSWQNDADITASVSAILNLQFLNRQERQKNIKISNPEYLFKFMSGAHTNLQLKATIYYTDATTHTGVVGTAVGSSLDLKVYCFPSGFNALSLGSINPSKTPVKYEVFLTNDALDVLSETITYIIDHRYYESNTEFIFLGSCGAMETVWCHGYSSKEIVSESDTYQLTKLPWYAPGDALLKHSNNIQNSNTAFSTGYKTKAYIEWLQELANSGTMLMAEAGQWIAVRLVKKSIKTMPNLLDDTFTLTFEIERIEKTL